MFTGYDYEDYCCEYLKKHHFKNIEHTPLSGDHGVDIIARKGRKKYAFQCKYYTGKVGNHAIQQVYTGCSYYKCDVAVVITNSVFTKNAIAEAKRLGIQLWDNIEVEKKRHLFIKLFLLAALILAVAYYMLPNEQKSWLHSYFINLYQTNLDIILLVVFLLAAIIVAAIAIKKIRDNAH